MAFYKRETGSMLISKEGRFRHFIVMTAQVAKDHLGWHCALKGYDKPFQIWEHIGA